MIKILLWMSFKSKYDHHDKIESFAHVDNRKPRRFIDACRFDILKKAFLGCCHADRVRDHGRSARGTLDMRITLSLFFIIVAGLVAASYARFPWLIWLMSSQLNLFLKLF